MFEEPRNTNKDAELEMMEDDYRDDVEGIELDETFSSRHNRNVFEEIKMTGHDEDFVPAITDEFCPTDAPAGTPAKVEVLAERVRKGLPLWHPEDRVSYQGLTGAAGRKKD